MPQLRVIVVEDEPLYRDMLILALADEYQFEVVAEYSDSESVLSEIETIDAHVATLDIRIPGPINGFELGLRLREAHPHLGLVFLSNFCEPTFMEALKRRSLTGWAYLLKNSLTDLATLRRALHGVTSGDLVVDPAVAERLRARKDSVLERLTERQQEVLELIVRGYTNNAIAEKLFLSRKTVENVINQIYQQLDIDSKDPNVQPRVTSVLKYLAETIMIDV